MKYFLLQLIFTCSISFMYGQGNWTIYNSTNSGLTFDVISDIEFDSEGNKWIASWSNSSSGGIAKFDDLNWTIFNTSNSNITDNRVVDIAIDKLDIKWIGTRQNGLVRYDDNTWTTYTMINSGLPNDNIDCVVTDNNDNVWIGTSSGLTKFDGNIWTTFNSANSDLPDNSIISIAIDDADHVWISTSNELVEYTGVDWNTYNNNSIGNSFGNPSSLVIDNNNTKWMSAGFGVQSFDGSNWEYFNFLGANSSCLLDCQIKSLSVDLNNDIWIGSQMECNNGGLLNLTKCDEYLSSNSDLPGNSILSVNIDDDGIKWIGTFSGLAKLETLSTSLGEQSIEEILLYPNPVDDYLNVEIHNQLIGNKFTIVDARGRVIKKGNFTELVNTININMLGEGLYFLEILADNSGIKKIFKFVK